MSSNARYVSVCAMYRMSWWTLRAWLFGGMIKLIATGVEITTGGYCLLSSSIWQMRRLKFITRNESEVKRLKMIYDDMSDYGALRRCYGPRISKSVEGGMERMRIYELLYCVSENEREREREREREGKSLITCAAILYTFFALDFSCLYGNVLFSPAENPSRTWNIDPSLTMPLSAE